jgi:hypothetical protein
MALIGEGTPDLNQHASDDPTAFSSVAAFWKTNS